MELKEKIIMVTNTCPFPCNYGGKVGTLSNLKILSKKFDVYLYGLLEKDDVIDDKELSKYCKEYNFFSRKKNYLNCLMNFFHPYLLVSRRNRKLRKKIKSSIKENNIKYIFADSLLILDNITDTEQNLFVYEQNIEFEALKSIGKGKCGLKKIIYKIQSFLLEKYEKKIVNRKNLKGICFISFEEQKKFCDITKYNKESTLYLPTIYQNEISNKINKKDDFDVLMVANYKYSPNIFGLNWFLDNCLEKLIKEDSNIKIAFVGRGLPKEVFDKYKSSKNVLPIGEVDSVAQYYENSKVVIIPLFQGAGVKIKLLEAVSYDKPIVCTTKTVEGTRFDDNSVWIANKPDEFVEGIIKLFKDETISKQKVLCAKKIFSEDYNQNVLADKLYKFIIR